MEEFDTDGLAEEQKKFLEQVCVSVRTAVAAALSEHEKAFPHVTPEKVQEAVQMHIADDGFEFPIDKLHERRHDRLNRNVGVLLDVVVGPVRRDFLGDPHPDGERDETQGMMAKQTVATAAAEKLDEYLENGGVPVRLPTNIKAAIWGAAGTITAAGITAVGVVLSSL